MSNWYVLARLRGVIAGIGVQVLTQFGILHRRRIWIVGIASVMRAHKKHHSNAGEVGLHRNRLFHTGAGLIEHSVTRASARLGNSPTRERQARPMPHFRDQERPVRD